MDQPKVKSWSEQIGAMAVGYGFVVLLFGNYIHNSLPRYKIAKTAKPLNS